LNNTLSKGLETIITKCTQNNPDERYQSAHELKEALEKYKEIGTPKLKSYKKILTLFAVDTTLTLTCAGASAGLEHEHMELCAKIFSGYATILLALGISMYFMFDIKGVVMVLKNKKTSQTATCKVQNSEPLKNDKRTVQLPQALAVVMLLVFTTGIFSTKSYAAQTRIIINDTDENPDNIQIIEMIPDDIVNESDEHDYTIYVFNISHPANEYPSNELQIIDKDENPIPKSDTIPNTNTQNNSPMLTIILASVMACVILIMISMVVRLYIVTTKEKHDA
jgi:serine/threonine protein kinase